MSHDLNRHHTTVILKTSPWLRAVITQSKCFAETSATGTGFHRTELTDLTLDTISTLITLFFQVLNQVLNDDLFVLARDRMLASETVICMLMSEFEGYGHIPREFTPEETDVVISLSTNLLDDLIVSIDERNLAYGTQFTFERLVAYDILVNYTGNTALAPAPASQRQRVYQEHITYDHDTAHERQWV